MELPLYQIDAFAGALFRGNPAAVCPLDRWPPDAILQDIAAENNLAETAYYVRKGDRYDLRWFTPTVEVDLCGHATLAAASVILEFRRETPGPRVVFDSRGGELVVERKGDLYELDFPARPPVECAPDPALVAALGAKPLMVLAARDCLCVFESQDQVRALRPRHGPACGHRLVWVHRHRSRSRLRLRIALLRPLSGRTGRSGHRKCAHHPDSLLVPPAGQEEDVRAPSFAAGRGAVVRGPGRPRRNRGPRDKISTGNY